MREQSQETRLNILGAAVKHFAKFGYSGASMAKIAAQAGVSKSLVFWYFQSKGKLFESLIDGFVDECLKTLSMSNQQSNAQKKIENLIDIYWEFVKKNLDLIQVFMNWFIQLDAKEKAKAEQLRNIHSKFEAVFQGYLREGIDEKLFDPQLDVEATSLAIVSTLEGVLIQIFILKVEEEKLDQYFCHTIKHHILYGILARS